MIVRDSKSEIQTPLERIERETKLFALAKAEQKNSSEDIAEKVAEIVCENAVCIADSKCNVINVKLLNGQIFRLTVEKVK